MQFVKAVRRNIKARVALIGPAGGGKTWNGLEIAKVLGGRTAFLDTEHGSAKKYADTFDFDVLELESFSPAKYVEVIEMAERAGYDNLIIDSLSHAWMGKNGALEMVDRAAARSRSQNSFMAWREVTPEHNALVEAMLASKLNLIITMRTKAEYVIEEDDRGKKVPRKIGLQPVQRDGLDYEFDVTIDLDMTNTMVVGKSRCAACPPGTIFKMPQVGTKFGKVLKEWLAEGKAEPTNGASRGASDPKPALAILEDRIARGSAAEVEHARAELLKMYQAGQLTKEDTERVGRLVNEAKQRLAAAPPPSEPVPAFLQPEEPPSRPQSSPPPAAHPEAVQAPAALLPEPEREPLRESIVEGLVAAKPANESAQPDGPASFETMEVLTDSMKANGIRSRDGVEKFVAANAPGFTLNGLTEGAANLLIEKLGEMGLERLSGAK